MESNELTIVIVTFRSDEKIINCLKSITSEIPVIVVENSNNKSFKKNIENQFSNVNCILTGENKGYSVANNIGLKLVKSKYALVLNPDTKLDESAIKNFLYTANNQKDFWLLGPVNDQGIKYSTNSKQIIEVDNLKGFAIFLIWKNLKKNILMKIIFYILKK